MYIKEWNTYSPTMETTDSQRPPQSKTHTHTTGEYKHLKSERTVSIYAQTARIRIRTEWLRIEPEPKGSTLSQSYWPPSGGQSTSPNP
jgi:hypothetical protein